MDDVEAAGAFEAAAEGPPAPGGALRDRLDDDELDRTLASPAAEADEEANLIGELVPETRARQSLSGRERWGKQDTPKEPDAGARKKKQTKPREKPPVTREQAE